MITKELSRIVDRGSESNTYYSTDHDFFISNEEENIPLGSERGEDTSGTSTLAQVSLYQIADLLASLTANVSFTSTCFPKWGKLIFEEQSLVAPLSYRPPELMRDIDRLISILESEPIEDGISHAGEINVKEIIATYGADGFISVILETRLPSLAAAMIRLLGRVAAPAKEAQHRLIKAGLSSDSVEIRDAIVQAIELWEDKGGVDILREHEETIPWLADYIRRVIDELRG